MQESYFETITTAYSSIKVYNLNLYLWCGRL